MKDLWEYKIKTKNSTFQLSALIQCAEQNRSCCGVYSLAEMPYNEDIPEYSVSICKKLLKMYLKDAKKSFGMIDCYMVSNQLETTFGKAVQSVFKKVGTFYNPSSGNTVTHFIYVLNKSKPRKKKSKRRTFRG